MSVEYTNVFIKRPLLIIVFWTNTMGSNNKKSNPVEENTMIVIIDTIDGLNISFDASEVT